MDDKKSDVLDGLKLLDYKDLETRLYGELLKTCRRYNSKLSIISIVGILEIISQEMKDLDKTDFKDIEEEIIHNRDSLDRLV